MPTNTKNYSQLKIRLPMDVKAYLEAEAEENSSSQCSEVVRAIRIAMKAKGTTETAISSCHGSQIPA